MRNRLSILLLCFVFGMTACFEDDSSLGMIEVGNIEIGKMPDTSIISYNGNVLRVKPDVTTGYPESEMRYAWYIYGGALEEKSNYRAHRIDENGEKELAYEVNLPSGAYTVVFEAMAAANSFTRTATFALNVSTPFSQGFYILTETADGNTELDLLTDDGLVEGLMKSVTGVPLAGKPLSLSVVYNNGYIDESDLVMKENNMVHVFTEQDYRAFRAEDMYQTFSRENLMFEPVPADETFCAAMTDVKGIVFLSNKGFYRSSAGVSSGKLGVPEIEGGSRYIQSLNAGLAATVFWNGDTHSLCEMSKGDLSEEDPRTGKKVYELPAGVDAADLECLASGMSYSASGDVAWFLCQDRNSGKRLLFRVTAEQVVPWPPTYELRVELRVLAAGKHLATGNVIAGNGLDASVIYVADNDELYLYDLETGTETFFTLQGLEGEITYISNNYLNRCDFLGRPMDGNFNYLVVATRRDQGYKLYFYDKLVGGIPAGAAKRVVEGSGTVKGVRYLSAILTSNDWRTAMFGYAGPLYPYGD